MALALLRAQAPLPPECVLHLQMWEKSDRASQKAGLGALLEHGTGTVENVLIPFFPLLSIVTDWFQRLCKAGLFCLGTSQSTVPLHGGRESRSHRGPFFCPSIYYYILAGQLIIIDFYHL